MTKDVAWPQVLYEERPWAVSHEYGVSRSAQRRHAGPYKAAIVHEIASLDVNFSREVTLAAEDALQELVRFDAETAARGEIAPLAAVLLRSESVSSSQIENLTSGARQIAIATLGEPAASNAELIAANGSAMEAAIRLADRLDGASIIEMQQALLGATSVASWRDAQVWIGGSNVGPHNAEFVPPHPGNVAGLMRDLEQFMARDDLPAVVQAAIAHAQFETIHPFPDGNGRTGRALIHAFLRAKGVIRHVTVPVSAGLLADTTGYFAALDTYRAGDPDRIVLVLSDAVFAATANARMLLTDLEAALDVWRGRLKMRSDSVVWRVLPVLFRQPVVNTAFVAETFQVSLVAAQKAVDQLVEAAILREFTGRKRSRLWVSDDVIGHLDSFADRAGRRR